MTPKQAVRKAAKAFAAYEEAMNLALEVARDTGQPVPSDVLWDVHRVYRELLIATEEAAKGPPVGY